MKNKELYDAWKHEEDIAHIKGWDFSHIKDRYVEETDLPWNLKAVIEKYLHNNMELMDMETGGGEFLLELNHPHNKTAAIEGYTPNVELCKQRLLPLGINFKQGDGDDPLPFDNNSFDIVTNRHGSFIPSELHRVLKQGGIFVTQQVGAENDLELVRLLQPELKTLPYPDQYLDINIKALENAGFDILESGECYKPIRFYDVGLWCGLQELLSGNL